MEEDYIPISTLNDFIFCPYSIYLHNIYMETDENIYHATPQIRGKIEHSSVDNKTASNRKDDIVCLPVYSDRYKLMGKIDIYKKDTHHLIERKYQLKQIFRGQIYQLWAQKYCLEEMGYKVDRLSFYEISTNKMISINLPSDLEEQEFTSFIEHYHSFDPSAKLEEINTNKCMHCIYNNLCDKTIVDNVY